ncbi:hypothetical protein BHE74_00017418 [Ensete ventricosum]|nr:hypothetical protein BHE74_00017418 [Ensete ventricosum]
MGVEVQEPHHSEFVEVDPTGRYGRVLHDFLQSPDNLERLYCEIHLLKTLKHQNIMRSYASWLDTCHWNINFVTELFSSGTLRHHDPPIIHRDLKCDNIFINGNQGEVKIGDLGLAVILQNSPAVHCEHQSSWLQRVKDPGVRQFVEKCLAAASERLSARDLLDDPFLQVDDFSSHCVEGNVSSIGHILRKPSLEFIQVKCSLTTNEHANNLCHEMELENSWGYDATDVRVQRVDIFHSHKNESPANVDITIKGSRREDGIIFLRLRISDQDEADTSLSVANEMVAELDIREYDVTIIADMIDGEVASLVPQWKPGPAVEGIPGLPSPTFFQNYACNVSSCGSLLDSLSLKNQSTLK